MLVSLANCLSNSLRSSDIVGGEEFVCIAVLKTAHEAEAVFEKVRSAVETMEVSPPDTTLQVTVSISVTTILGNSREEMINLADAGVYRSKGKGRNRVSPL